MSIFDNDTDVTESMIVYIINNNYDKPNKKEDNTTLPLKEDA